MLLLLDSASLYYRSFYALPSSMRAPDGTQVNAVRGFLDMLARLIPGSTAIVCALDYDWRPAWRVEHIASYKTHRVAEGNEEETPDELGPQVGILLEVLSSLGIPTLGHDGYEADDVIGTLATTHSGHARVVSGDRDLLQLVSDRDEISMLYTASGGMDKWPVMTDEEVLAKYGVRPDQYVDFAVLRGDASDGLPGIPGIGEKTAAKLLAEHGSIDQLLTGLQRGDIRLTPKVTTALLDGREYIAAATAVTTVVRDLPLDPADIVPTPSDMEMVRELATRWGISSSVERVLKALGR